MDIKQYYENASILHEGTLPARSSFKSFLRMSKEECEKGMCPVPSERSLNGEWRFSFYESVRLGRQALANGSFRAEADLVRVPSTWQHTGYDKPQYINTRYPFPVDPPYVPAENPMGIYERKITVTEEEIRGHVIIRFDGVDSCFFLYVNEKYAGYSQVSHSMSEFDITKVLNSGENIITVCVLKWCDGSYLECQDKFRETGIFRDVDLLIRPADYIFDYKVSACPDETLSKGILTVETDKLYDFDIECELRYEASPVAKAVMKDGKVTLIVDKPRLWNAESPSLYSLSLTTPYERIEQRVGFRRIDIKDGVFRINNVCCKMKGVNYHDSNPYEGARLTREQAIEDLTLMKQANINAIRTSHYPKPHWFMELCDLYGFYIVDEADIETHGASYIYIDGEREVSSISRMPEFKAAFVDRIRLLYERDKNHSCVILWSLGNESGYGENLVAGAKFLHSRDSRPVHYEGADRPYSFTLPTDVLDVYSNMYASPADVEEYCTNNPERLSRPYMQCEFCHAMGNGPGDLLENVEQLYKFKHYFGAFVWEWCDHAVYDGKDARGRERFLYGGDSGEVYHDGNFCMDGLVYPDRRVHTGYLEYKNIIRPIRLVSYNRETGEAVFENKYDYIDALSRIRILYEIKEEGRTVSQGEVTTPEAVIKDGKLNDNQYIIFSYIAKTDFSLVKEGFNLGFDEVEPISVNPAALSEAKRPRLTETTAGAETTAETESTEKGSSEKISVQSTDYEFTVSGNCFSYVFDRELGGFSRIEYKGEELITRPMEFNVLRAYIDNDRNVWSLWKKYGYNDTRFKVHYSELSVSRDLESVSIDFDGVLAAPYRSFAVKIAATWIIRTDGTLHLFLKGIRNTNMEYLPRFGLRIFVPNYFDRVEYFGYGPHESYIDKHRSCRLDLFNRHIDEMSEPYVKPQETGSRYGTQYLRIAGEKCAVKVTGKESFSFNLSRYTAEKQIEAAHIYELYEEPDNVLCIDYKMSGCGSNSCGPELDERYRLKEERFEWEIMISPSEI